MARDPKISDQNSIDAILRSLANRPNVEHILILSRRDGSIIQATGFAEAEKISATIKRAYNPHQSNEARDDATQSDAETQNGQEDTNTQSNPVSAVQRLAGSIFAFVDASSKLAEGLSWPKSNSTIANSDAPSGSGDQSTGQGSDQIGMSVEEDVQLLRMRTRKQEIIIFPDPNYLGCVIQNLSKQTGRFEPL